MRGIAWPEGWARDRIKVDFGATSCYHGYSYHPSTWASGAIPMLRMIETTAAAEQTWVAQLHNIVKAGYKGDVVLGNEPDSEVQDNCDAEKYWPQYKMAHYYLRQVGSKIRLIVGNVVRSSWYVNFHDKAGGWLLPGDIWGCHIYQKPDMWRYPTRWLNKVCERAQTDRLIVTEYGLESAWGRDTLRGYINDVENHSAVVASFPYFGTGDGQYDLYKGTKGGLTVAGQALKAA